MTINKGRICLVEDCTKPADCRSMCDMHYRRWKNHNHTRRVRAYTDEERRAKIRTHGKCLSEHELRRLRTAVGLPPEGPSQRWNHEQSIRENADERKVATAA